MMLNVARRPHSDVPSHPIALVWARDSRATIWSVLQRVISGIMRQIPVAWRRKIIGQPGNPSRVATLAHRALNRISDKNLRSYPCIGALDGYRMYVDWAQFRGFIYDSWEPEVVRKTISETRPGMTVVDVGAHIGYYTLLFAKNVGATGRVISFEPAPNNFAVLAKNVELNGLAHVRLFDSAIFSRCGKITISIPDHSNSGEASVSQSVGATHVQVNSTTLDAVSSSLDLHPDFLKIDVEGSETDVLAGAQKTIRRCRPKMLIELHHFDGNLKANPVPTLLASMGYDVEWIERSAWTSHIFASPRGETSYVS
jgi:FkbM family methyltransferase